MGAMGRTPGAWLVIAVALAACTARAAAQTTLVPTVAKADCLAPTKDGSDWLVTCAVKINVTGTAFNITAVLATTEPENATAVTAHASAAACADNTTDALVSCAVNYTLAAGDISAGKVSLKAYVTGVDDADPPATLNLTASVDDVSLGLGQLTVASDAVTPPAGGHVSGTTVSTTITVTNVGPTDLAGVVLTPSTAGVTLTNAAGSADCALATATDVASGAAATTCKATYNVTDADMNAGGAATKALSWSATTATTADQLWASVPVADSQAITLNRVADISVVQGGWTPSPVNISGINATGTFNLTNNGTVALPHVRFNASSDAQDPRVAAIVLACTNFVNNGSLPIGTTLVQCTERLGIENVTFIEGGDVVFNLTVANDAGLLHRQQVTIPVDNTPALALAVNVSKCGSPSPANTAGSNITCTDAVTLTNTGTVRLDVDDIVINATGAAVWPQGCALAATGLNLTAVNATLLPGQSLVCSFGATPTQGAYEAGLVTVDVKAVGVAAYGTHPAIAGVIGGVVPSSANLTLARNPNVTVQSSVINSVRQVSDTVTYRVVVSNTGNLLLSNVSLTTNVPEPAWNASALADGLSVGEVVELATNLTFNASMIRAGNATLSTNITGAAATANMSVWSANRVNVFWCADNSTSRPNNGRDCLNTTDCGNATRFCNLTGPLGTRYTCNAGAVDITHDMGVCQITPCARCQECMNAADVLAYINSVQAVTDAATVASGMDNLCRQKAEPEERMMCAPLVNATRASFRGNTGKRLGLACSILGFCANVTASCNLARPGAAAPAGLDLCTPDGRNTTTTRVPDVAAANATLAAGTCLTDADCGNTTDSHCVMPGNTTLPSHITRRAVCDPATGVDTVTVLGQCQATPCKRCRDCYTAMAPFSDTQKGATDAKAVSDAFKAKCADPGVTGLKFEAAACAKTATDVLLSVQGNIAKRPALLCGMLGACDPALGAECQLATGTVVNLTIANADICTVDSFPFGAAGASKGQLVPSNTLVTNAASNATRPNATASNCYTDDDCGESKCSFAGQKQWCQCFNPGAEGSSEGGEQCTPVGQCIASATCANCAKCVASVLPFVRDQPAGATADTVAGNWQRAAAQRYTAMGVTPADGVVDAVHAAIRASPNGNAGRRAGVLCSLMQFCVPSFVGEASTCKTINSSVIASDGNATFSAGALDLCTVEGVGRTNTFNATMVTAANATDIPANTCIDDTPANSNCQTGYQCDLSVPRNSAVCVCEGATGVDTCTPITACSKTPCKRCSDCLATMSKATLANQFATSEAAGRAAVQAACNMAYPGACSAIAAMTANELKRAGSICAKITECDADTLPAGCDLAFEGFAGDGPQQLDLCSVEGLAGGRDVPDTSRGALPAGLCDGVNDCAEPAQSTCDKTSAPLSYTTCTPSSGSDNTRAVGRCTLKPEFACGACLDDFGAWVADANNAHASLPAATLAAAFAAACKALPGDKYPAAACNTAAQVVASSPNGNRGRRAGAVCQLLQRCMPASLAGKQVTVSGQEPANFSMCTQEGVVSGASVANFPLARNTVGKCTSDSSCSAGQICDMSAAGAVALGAAGSCQCDAANGRDTCIRLGVCVDTPCRRCQACLSEMRIASVNTSSASFNGILTDNTAFTSRCAAVTAAPAGACAAITSSYWSRTGVPGGYFGLRAGAVCTALQQCVNLPASCSLNATSISAATNVTGALDMCTAEGVAGGTQLARVHTGPQVPAGRCLRDADCASAAQQCDVQATTNFFACSGGLDTVRRFGACVDRPVVVERTPQQRCQVCLDVIRPAVDAAVSGTSLSAATLASSFYTACSTANFSLTACSRVHAAVAASQPNLARRAGGLCMRMGQCSTRDAYTVAANSSIVNATALAGTVDACTIEGVAAGRAPALNSLAAGITTCISDSQCNATSFCSSAAPQRVCKCVDGLDTCDSLAVCTPIPVPPPPPPVKTGCDVCKDCIAGANTWIAANASVTDPWARAASFLAACTAANGLAPGDVVACRAVSAAMAANPNIGQRPGALCRRLGQCGTAAAEATCIIAGTNQTLSLCSANGTVNGAPVYAAGNTTGKCTPAGGCATTGEICSMASPDLICTCRAADGTDSCQNHGMCVPFCSTQAAFMSSFNAAVPKCNSASDSASCGTGFRCTASDSCRQLSCTPGVGIVVDKCYGLCTATTRNPTSAKLSDDGSSIVVGLNTAARSLSFPCINLFDAATRDKVGAFALCSVSGTTLTVQLAPGATIMPDADALMLSGSQVVLRDAVDGTAFTQPAEPLTLAPCTSCKASTVTIVGPKSVPAPCDAASATDVVFDGSFSVDGLGRPLAKFTWTADPSNVALTAAMSAANAANSARLVVPGAALGDIPAATYTLTLTVTNFLGATASGTFAFAKGASADAPVVSVPGGLAQAFSVAQGLRVATQLVPTSVCPNKQVVWEWTAVDATGWAADAIPAGYSLKDLVIPGPVLGATAAKAVQLRAYFAGSEASAVTYTVTLTPISSDMSAVLRAPRGDVRATSDALISLNASRSSDPDAPSTPFSVGWACSRTDNAPCFTGTAAGIQDGLAWTIPAAELTPEVAHTFTVTLSKGARRPAATSVTLTPRAEAIPTGRIVRQCGAAACPPKHSVDAPLALSVVLDAGTPSGASVAWSSDQVAGIADFNGKSDLVLPPASLPASGSVTVAATLTAGGKSSTTSVVVPINAKPSCSRDGASGCLVLAAASDVFPGASFSAQSVGVLDDSTNLRFDFGTVSSTGMRKLLASGPAPTFTFVGLPVGDTTVYMCAADAEGAQLCQTATATVKPAPADFQVSDALTSLDVEQLQGAGDVSVLASGAQTLQSLATFAGSNSAGQSAAVVQQVRDAIAAKTSALISALATNANSYMDDPQTMQQVVSTVSTLSKTSSVLSKEAKGKMLGVAKAGITAAKVSGKPLAADAASRLLSVVAAGVGVPASAAQAAAAPARRRSLLQAADTPFTPAYTADANDVATTLLASLTPGDAYKSSGDSGLFVGVAQKLGRSYTSAPVVLGPALLAADDSMADAESTDNAIVTFSGNMVANCTADDSSPLTDSDSCAVPVVAVFTASSTPALDGDGTSAAIALPDGFEPVSGALTLQVDGRAAGLLPCAAAGCTAKLTFPVPAAESAKAGRAFMCVRVNAAGKMQPDTAAVVAGEAAQRAGDASAPRFSCDVKQAGTYLLGSYTRPAAPAPAQAVPEVVAYDNVTGYAVGTPVSASFRFELGANVAYETLFATDAAMDAFKASVKSQLASSLRIPEAAITISRVFKGSIVVEATFATDSLTAAQLNNLVGTIQNRPAVLFDQAFLASYGITGVSASLLTPAAPAPLLPINTIIGAVVGGVGGALLVGGIVWLVIRKRRAASVEPRNRGVLPEHEHDV